MDTQIQGESFIMKILVTGGKGFIGSKIVEMLSKDHKVTVVDNHDTYGIMTKEDLHKLLQWRTRNWKAENVSVIDGDILDRLVCLKAFSHNPEIVIHLATYPRAKIVDEDPIVGIPKVINTTTNLLWHSEKWNVKKFVYVSSSMVYGDFVDGTKEDASTKPKNIYGEAKLTGERMVKLFAKRDGLNYNIIRPSGVYGPGDMPDRVVSKFFAKAMKNETITLHNGDNKVDFTYRQDAARGIVLAALSSVANVSFNITAGNATSLRTLAETIIKITGSESDIEDIGNHKLYPMRGTLDISRAKDLLDYEPEFSLKQGLDSYYDWLQNKI
jgi:nucleoside-diphosphate-sugar epimerase|tara:strand:+ start:17 stop:997 length:981 start_codon:yes stop_codon:yes gene_type:complete